VGQEFILSDKTLIGMEKGAMVKKISLSNIAFLGILFS
jgi:hypothetical protein